jgi:hypothetical protein
MTTIYRVTVVAEHDGDVPYETLFEVAGPIATVLRIAPGALTDAIQAAGEPVPASLADRVFDSAVAAGTDTPPAPEKPKRTRRTKEQIAADAAAANGATPAPAAPLEQEQPATSTAIQAPPPAGEQPWNPFQQQN